MKGGVLKNMNSPIRRYTEEAKQGVLRLGGSPDQTLFGGTRVEYRSEISTDLPTGLSLGRDDRKLGLGDKQEPKAPLTID